MSFNPNAPAVIYKVQTEQSLFTFDFKIYVSDDMLVQRTDVVTDISTVVSPTEYTITIDGDDGGTVEFHTVQQTNDVIFLNRVLDIERTIEYQRNGDIFAETLNIDQDYQTYLIADVQAVNSNYLHLPITAIGVSGELPQPLAEQYLRWNEDGTQLINDFTYPQAVQDANASAMSAKASEDIAVASAFDWKSSYMRDKATAPTTDLNGNALTKGDLYFDTTLDEVRVYNGSIWKSAGSTVNGTSKREHFTATADQTTFVISGGYDPTFADVYLNGTKLVNGVDVDTTSGTSVVLTAGAQLNDTIDVVAYGVFEVSNVVDIDSTQTITGKKTFTQSPIITDAVNNNEAVSLGQMNNKPSGMKNLLINGGFDVWQRGTNFTKLEGYGADRWIGAGVDIVKIPGNNKNWCSITGSSTAFARISQRIEDGWKLFGKVMTLSFELKVVSNTQDAYIYIITESGANITDTSIDFTTEGKKSVTLTMPTGVIGNYLEIRIHTNGSENVSARMDIADIQLEEGPVATPFEIRPYGLELSLCQRYYQLIPYISEASTINSVSGRQKTNTIYEWIPVKLIVPMRTLPSILLISGANGNGNIVRDNNARYITSFGSAKGVDRSPYEIRSVSNEHFNVKTFSEADDITWYGIQAGYEADAEIY